MTQNRQIVIPQVQLQLKQLQQQQQINSNNMINDLQFKHLKSLNNNDINNNPTQHNAATLVINIINELKATTTTQTQTKKKAN